MISQFRAGILPLHIEKGDILISQTLILKMWKLDVSKYICKLDNLHADWSIFHIIMQNSNRHLAEFLLFYFFIIIIVTDLCGKSSIQTESKK